MGTLVKPHGREGKLRPLLLSGEELAGEQARAGSLKKILITSRESSDCVMLGIGAFTPLNGFMSREDWLSCCSEMRIADGTFWPLPITLSISEDEVAGLGEGEEIALHDAETSELVATMRVEDRYRIDKALECRAVFRTTDGRHPGVAKVMGQKPVNVSGPLRVLSEMGYPRLFEGLYQRPAEARTVFERCGWRSVAALQLRNPMHRSHEHIAKIAAEFVDGIYVHQLLGKLKAGDVPAAVRARCVDVLVRGYFAPDRVVQGGYPLEMRYAGPREALLHACFRQNYGCSHLIVGRDHAGVGGYYGPLDAQKIFSEIPEGALELKPLCMDVTFYCYRCGGMSSGKTCPHGEADRLNLSGTALRKILESGEDPPAEFTRPEVAAILKDYYRSIGKIQERL